jgi:hypothetical protein
MKNVKKIIFLLIISAFILSQKPALAVEYYEQNPDFNHNLIIADTDMTDIQALDMQNIQQFLIQKGGALANYLDPTTGQTAAWTIWQTAQEYGISPKFLLTLLQKEQSLVTDTAPDQDQYDWAVGFSCYGGTCMDQYKGFSMQLRSAANKFINTYMRQLNESGCTFTNWCVGIAKMTQDEVMIVPQNKATASLYTYNPYRGGTIIAGGKIGANYNFWKIWNSWFSHKTIYPDGALLKSDTDKTVWLIKNGQKRAFGSWTALITRYDPGNIVTVPSSYLDNYEIGPEIKYPQYALLKDPANNNYLIIDDLKRKIYDSATFRTLGFNPEESIEVSQAEIDAIPNGEVITIASAYPLGAVLQSKYNNALFYVQNGKKYPLVDKKIADINYPGYKITKVSVDELEKYFVGDPIFLRDNTLIKVKESSQVYVISDGKKLPIASESTFNNLGYKWNKIITVSKAVLDLHPTGETLNVDNLN